MANTFYSYLAFIQPTSNADINILKTKLENFYESQKSEERPNISLNNSEIILTFQDGYNFYIVLSEEQHIITEANEFAQDSELDWKDTPFDKEKLKISCKRFEIYGDDDYDMDYFNDSLFIIEIIEEFSDIIIIFMD